MSQPPNPLPPIGDQISEAIRQILKPGGVAVGSGVAFWQLSANGSVGKAVVAFLIGAGTSYGAKMLSPLHKRNLETAEQLGEAISGVGEAFGEVTQRAITAASGFEGRYLLCQASDCESVRAEGVAQREGIFEPLLKDVFVELRIDGNASLPGFSSHMLEPLEQAEIPRQTIWDFLTVSKEEKAFRQLAILAWGGYGKTTLLKHVAYRYGIGDVPKDAPKLIPVLIVLRKYKGLLAQASPPNLHNFICTHHIPGLPEAHQLQPVPSAWVKEILRKGRALIMFDGFDEVPREERPAVAKWINIQMREYQQSVFIMTSRPKAYREQDFESRLVLSMPMWVQPFDSNQRRNFVESWYLSQEKMKALRDTPEVRKIAATSAEDLLQQIEAKDDLKDLAKNPLLLNMISTFHRLYPGAALPKRQVDLYDEICHLQLKARPRDRRLKTVLLEFEPQPVLEAVAFSMMERSQKRIDSESLLRKMAEVLSMQEESISATKLLRDIVRISELMVQQEDEYEFAHLSFQEYLAAAYVAAKPYEREQWLYDRLEHDWWKSTILLYAGKTSKPSQIIQRAIQLGVPAMAHACLQQTTKRVDAELRIELESLAEQVQDARYTDLGWYLRKGEWKKADDETYRLMITEVGREEGQLLTPEELRNFPCEPLKTIDSLWVKHSNGHFGFSVQKDMYVACGGLPDGRYDKDAFTKLCEANGWKENGNWVDLAFKESSPKGHLPGRMMGCLVVGSGGVITRMETSFTFSSLALKLTDCNL